MATWRELSPWEAAGSPVLGTLLFSHLIIQELRTQVSSFSFQKKKWRPGGGGVSGPKSGLNAREQGDKDGGQVPAHSRFRAGAGSRLPGREAGAWSPGKQNMGRS